MQQVKDEIIALTPRLRRFAWALTGSREDADDLVQATCLKALASLDQFQPDSNLPSWMFRIMRTTWIDQTRSRARRPTVDAPEAIDAVSDEGSIVRGLEARLTLRRVREAMAELPADQREILALVAVEGLSYREAADAAGVPIGTVMSRLARARAKLAGRLEKAA